MLLHRAPDGLRRCRCPVGECPYGGPTARTFERDGGVMPREKSAAHADLPLATTGWGAYVKDEGTDGSLANVDRPVHGGRDRGPSRPATRPTPQSAAARLSRLPDAAPLEQRVRAEQHEAELNWPRWTPAERLSKASVYGRDQLDEFGLEDYELTFHASEAPDTVVLAREDRRGEVRLSLPRTLSRGFGEFRHALVRQVSRVFGLPEPTKHHGEGFAWFRRAVRVGRAHGAELAVARAERDPRSSVYDQYQKTCKKCGFVSTTPVRVYGTAGGRCEKCGGSMLKVTQRGGWRDVLDSVAAAGRFTDRSARTRRRVRRELTEEWIDREAFVRQSQKGWIGELERRLEAEGVGADRMQASRARALRLFSEMGGAYAVEEAGERAEAVMAGEVGREREVKRFLEWVDAN